MRSWLRDVLFVVVAIHFSLACDSSESPAAGESVTDVPPLVGADAGAGGSLIDAGPVPAGDAHSNDVGTSADGDSGETNRGGDWGPCPAVPDGSPGCPCEGNGDCTSGWCVATADGSLCTDTCLETCPQGWSCSNVTNTAGDTTYICLPRFTNLCRPCMGNADCAADGGTSLCISMEDGSGSFCGGSCGQGAPCPIGYDCESVSDGTGGEVEQCRPSSGVCACSPKARAEGAATACAVSNEHGTCGGTRSCGSDGLGPCSAGAPAIEQCNGVDDDCDGDVDEAGAVGCKDWFADADGDGHGQPGSAQCLCAASGEWTALSGEDCDDGNPGVHPGAEEVCNGADDDCDGSDEAPCDDGDACTEGDLCVVNAGAGTCVPGAPSACDDGDPCTDDACDSATGCVATANAAPCDDGDACTVGDACAGGTCMGGGAVLCDDGNPCTTAACDPASGCAFVPNVASCDDGDACTAGDACSGGTCAGSAALVCDDDNPCTEDACSMVAGCQHVPISGSCEDGDACTAGDVCAEGACVSGAVVVCDDGNPCTADTCVPAAGCEHAAMAGVCDDGDACTAGDKCVGGLCTGGAVACDDGNPCTVDSCAPTDGCHHVSGAGSCDDGDACTANDTCAGGVCAGGAALACDDGNPCTADGCNAASGCTHTAASGGCDDGNACTTGEACASGQCVGGAALACDDGNPCTDDSCTAATGCLHASNSASCSDGDPCTTGDVCVAGACTPGAPLSCDDGKPCTADSCVGGACQHTVTAGSCLIDGACVASGAAKPGDPCLACTPGTSTGAWSATTAPCDDGNACTTGDACQGGTCAPGAALDCDDGNPCTADGCAPASGCLNAPAAGLCDDGDACTAGDTCSGGVCKPGSAVTCDDGQACTADSCVGGTGCVYTALAGQCDDGDACTVGDVCAGGACMPGAPLSCDDGNSCTADSCMGGTCQHTVMAGGCLIDGACVASGATKPGDPCLVCTPGTSTGSWSPTTAPCDDGDACTVGDACAAGLCKSGAPKECGDGKACTVDACVAGQCTNTLSSGYCLIGGSCVTSGTTSGQCKACDPAQNPGDWSAKGGACSDGNACTTGDSCVDGACVGGAPMNCDDGKPCTADSCVPASGCTAVPATGTCDDGNACTTNDACSGGSCVGGSALTCDDGNPCTTDSCSPGSGCVHTPNTATCSDGNPCTAGDVCSGGACSPGTPVVCNDGNPCSDDACDPASGCVYTANTAPCSDGNACTVGDACAGYSCKAGSMLSCDDGLACTVDSCVAPGGTCKNTLSPGSCLIEGACVASGTTQPGNACKSCQPTLLTTGWSNKSGSCDDGNGCTTSDTCTAGTCGGTPVQCNDGKACTADACVGGSCQYTLLSTWCLISGTCVASGTANPANTCTSCQPAVDGSGWTPREAPCEDGSKCTTGDACLAGSCASGAPVSCDDGKWCTADSCAPATGCLHTTVAGACHINGACVSAGTQKPDNPCLACQPELSTSQWSAYAGTCGPLPHATAVCAGGSCVIGACDEDWKDENAQAADGCEVSNVLWVDWLSEWGAAADGSAEKPYDSIHAALAVATPYAVIRVRDGFYQGAIKVLVKGVSIIGASRDSVIVTTNKTTGLSGFDVTVDDVRIEALTSMGGQTGIRVVGTAQAPTKNLTLQDLFVGQVQGSTNGTDPVTGVFLNYTVDAVLADIEVAGVTGLNGVSVCNSSQYTVGGPAMGVRVENSSSASIAGLRVANVVGGVGGAYGTCCSSSYKAKQGGYARAVSIVNSTLVSVRVVRADSVLGGRGGYADCSGSSSYNYGGPGGAANAIRFDGCSDCIAENVTAASIQGGDAGPSYSLSLAGPGGEAACIEIAPSPKLKVRNTTCYGTAGGKFHVNFPAPLATGTRVEAGQTTPIQLLDSIITNTGTNCLYSNSNNPSTTLSAAYSNLYNCGTGGTASNATVLADCIFVDPLYVDAAAGNFHLKPNSPCIDAGKPITECSFEPAPNGCRVNMGGYGNTPEATSKPGATHCAICP